MVTDNKCDMMIEIKMKDNEIKVEKRGAFFGFVFLGKFI